MPTSNLAMAPMVLWFVHEVEHRFVLDVGPGWGKYAVLMREYFNEKPVTIDAVEAHAPYIAAHRLDRLYDLVIPGDVCDLTDDDLAGYDVVLMVDVIEHIDKARALSVLDRIPGRIVICTPETFFQTDEGLPATEAHVSHWTLADFEATGRLEASTIQHGGIIVRLAPRPVVPPSSQETNP